MSLTTQLARLPLQSVGTPRGVVQFRRACPAGHAGPVTHVLLHGIGSASASWLAQLVLACDTSAPSSHVLAWDAPGYGASDPLPTARPDAGDYARRLWDWLDAVDADTRGALTLVGHSLGALMAARAAVTASTRVARLVLLAPAQGYANADAALREKKLSDRLAALEHLGPAGLAHQRAGAMLSAHANAEQIAFVEQVMAAIRPRGYTQAAHMLAGGDLAADLLALRCPVTIASGSADTITPAEGCRALAQRVGAAYADLGEVGHSCPLEAAARVNALIGIGGVCVSGARQHSAQGEGNP